MSSDFPCDRDADKAQGRHKEGDKKPASAGMAELVSIPETSETMKHGKGPVPEELPTTQPTNYFSCGDEKGGKAAKKKPELVSPARTKACPVPELSPPQEPPGADHRMRQRRALPELSPPQEPPHEFGRQSGGGLIDPGPLEATRSNREDHRNHPPRPSHRAHHDGRIGSLSIGGHQEEEVEETPTNEGFNHYEAQVDPIAPRDDNGGEIALQGFVVRSQRHRGRHITAEEQEQRHREHILRTAPLVDGVIVRENAGNNKKEAAQARQCTVSKSSRLAMGIALLCIVALVVTLSVLFIPSRQKGNTTNSAEPTPAQILEKYESLRAVVRTISSRENLEKTSSPQHKALVWLSNEDDYPVGLHDTDHIIQRYALATVFFATNGRESWINTHNFLSSKHECAWNEEVPYYEPRNWTSKGTFCSPNSLIVDVLKLPINNLTGQLPEEIGLLSGLKTLALYLNGLTGTMPSTLNNLVGLQYLALSGNKLTGQIPQGFGHMPQLQYLYLSKNDLTGSIPTSVDALAKLEYLNFRDNMLNGSLPFTSRSLPNLRQFSVRRNSLSGNPEAIFSNRNLMLVDCSSNLFTGTLPSEVGALNELVLLDLANNSFHGTLPSSVARLQGLDFFQVSQNNFTGTLPRVLGELSNLTIFNLRRNNFSGTLPDTLGNLTALSVLGLSENSLGSTVLATISKLASLDVLLLDNNNFHGNINFLCNISISLFTADCYGEERARVACDCCTACFCSGSLNPSDLVGCENALPNDPFILGQDAIEDRKGEWEKKRKPIAPQNR